MGKQTMNRRSPVTACCLLMTLLLFCFCPVSLWADTAPVTDGEAVPSGEGKDKALAEQLPVDTAEGVAEKSGTPTEETAFTDEAVEDEAVPISDPFVPVNRVMFEVNDRFYFWLLKPVAQAYEHIPADLREVTGNIYDNLNAPVRFINNALQLRVREAGIELARFLINSSVGVLGIGDAARDAFGIRKQEADFGQTMGHYGLGHGFYMVLPILGPSSLRDTVGLVGDRMMYPLTYIRHEDLSYAAAAGIAAHEMVNTTSFRLGDYESFKEAAIDPYVSMRDAFAQHRKKKVQESMR